MPTLELPVEITHAAFVEIPGLVLDHDASPRWCTRPASGEMSGLERFDFEADVELLPGTRVDFSLGAASGSTIASPHLDFIHSAEAHPDLAAPAVVTVRTTFGLWHWEPPAPPPDAPPAATMFRAPHGATPPPQRVPALHFVAAIAPAGTTAVPPETPAGHAPMPRQVHFAPHGHLGPGVHRVAISARLVHGSGPARILRATLTPL